MNEHSLCGARSEAHFAGRLEAPEVVGLREHLEACIACRRKYRRRALLANLDPRAPSAYQRIGQNVGILRRPAFATPVATVLIAAAAVVCLCFARPTSFDDTTFRARSARPIAQVSVDIYRARPDHTFEVVASEIRSDDELAFAYSNNGGFTHFLSFGVDEHGHVYWYHPAWTSAAENPESVRIEAGPAIHEIREAVAQTFDGSELRVVSIFTRAPLHVRDVEAQVARAHRDRRPIERAFSSVFLGATVIERPLKIVR